jgi:hypothetical protein
LRAKQRGKLTIKVTIKAKIQGQPKAITSSHLVHVVIKKKTPAKSTK